MKSSLVIYVIMNLRKKSVRKYVQRVKFVEIRALNEFGMTPPPPHPSSFYPLLIRCRKEIHHERSNEQVKAP